MGSFASGADPPAPVRKVYDLPHEAMKRLAPFLLFAISGTLSAVLVAKLLAPGTPAVPKPQTSDPTGAAKTVLPQSPEPGPVGRVTIDVQDPEGREWHSSVSIHILEHNAGVPLVTESFRPWEAPKLEWPRPFVLPVGDYVLLARAEPISDYHRRVREGRAFGDGRMGFSVREGLQEALVVRLTVPALLKVKVAGQVDDSDLATVRGAVHPGIVFMDSADVRSSRVRLRLRREGAYPTTVEFLQYAMANSSAAGTHLVDWMALESEATSSALPPGRYTLEARLPGGREVLRDVDLKSGETLEVQMDFSTGSH